jgi:hypothetical protein
MTGFFVSSQPPVVYLSGNIERSIAAYQDFVRAHFDPNGAEDPIDSSVGYVITTKIGDLAELQGNRVAGVERALDDLAAHAPTRARSSCFARIARARRCSHADRAATPLAAADTGACMLRARGAGVSTRQRGRPCAERYLTRIHEPVVLRRCGSRSVTSARLARRRRCLPARGGRLSRTVRTRFRFTFLIA